MNSEEKSNSFSLKQWLYQKRVIRELLDLANMLFAGELQRFAWRLLLQTLGIWLLIIAVDLIFDYFVPEPPCVSSCFTRNGQDCCLTSLWFAARIVVFLGGLFMASYFYTRRIKKGKFQASASLTAILIITLIIAHLNFPIPTSVSLLLLIPVFLIMFFGYRTALKRALQSKNPFSS